MLSVLLISQTPILICIQCFLQNDVVTYAESGTAQTKVCDSEGRGASCTARSIIIVTLFAVKVCRRVICYRNFCISLWGRRRCHRIPRHCTKCIYWTQRYWGNSKSLGDNRSRALVYECRHSQWTALNGILTLPQPIPPKHSYSLQLTAKCDSILECA